MSVIVVDNFENIVNIKKILRVIIIDDKGHFENTKVSIDSVLQISKDISISVFTKCNKYDYDVDILEIKPKENILSNINDLLLEKTENFFCILYAGDVLLNSFNDVLSNCMEDYDSVGAIIFDDYLVTEDTYNYKPNFSPDLYLEFDYINNGVFINRSAFNSIGGFNIEYPHNFIRDVLFRLFFNDYSFVKEDQVGFRFNHVTGIDFNENKLLLEDILSNQNIEFEIINSNNILKPIYDTQNKKASIIIPFKDQADVTKTCVESILEKTEYDNYEIILINNNSSDKKTFDFIEYISKNQKVNCYDYQEPFNWSKINNFGASVSSGDVLIFLNNDTEVISKEWLQLLIGDAIQERVGVVGPKLFYPDNTIQHAGVVIGLNSLAAHLFAGNNEEDIPDLYKLYRRNVSSVTGACLAIDKKLFYEVHGFNERFEVSFSDIEICLRLLEKGYDNIFNPDSKLFHHEMKTRSNKEFREIDRLLGYASFKYYFENGDPYFNTNYSLNHSDKLTLKQPGEVPGFKNYWDNWSKNRNNRVNKIHSIIKKNYDGSVVYYDYSNDDLINNGILMDNFFKNPYLSLDELLWFIPSFKYVTEDILYNLFMLPNFLSEIEGSNNILVLDNINQKSEVTKYIETNFPNMKFKIVSNLDNISEVNAAFCLDWKTAYKLLKFNKCESKFYILDDDYVGENNLLKNQSYHFNFIGISNSQNVISKYGEFNNSVKYISPSVNENCYFFDKNIDKINRSVFFHAENLSDNEFLIAVEILKIVKEYFGKGIKIFVEGKEFDSSKYGLDDVVVNLGIIKSSCELSKYYKQSLVVLNLVNSSNIIYKILNSMACGCVNITPFNDNLPIFLRDSENIIFTKNSITCIAEDVIRILHDVNLREKLVNNGLKLINQLSDENNLHELVNFIKHPNISFYDDFSDNNGPVEIIISKDVESKSDESINIINKLKYENNHYQNNERMFKLLNKRNIDEINRLNKELQEYKSKNKHPFIKKILK